jgi:hypothetical protein
MPPDVEPGPDQSSPANQRLALPRSSRIIVATAPTALTRPTTSTTPTTAAAAAETTSPSWPARTRLNASTASAIAATDQKIPTAANTHKAPRSWSSEYPCSATSGFLRSSSSSWSCCASKVSTIKASSTVVRPHSTQVSHAAAVTDAGRGAPCPLATSDPSAGGGQVGAGVGAGAAVPSA